MVLVRVCSSGIFTLVQLFQNEKPDEHTLGAHLIVKLLRVDLHKVKVKHELGLTIFLGPLFVLHL